MVQWIDLEQANAAAVTIYQWRSQLGPGRRIVPAPSRHYGMPTNLYVLVQGD